tara:strand:+ start:115 stop:462 length:348 start_codon:yes stop_codon:yes gene_type:complete
LSKKVERVNHHNQRLPRSFGVETPRGINQNLNIMRDFSGTILYVSESGKSAIVAVEQQFGDAVASFSGFTKLTNMSERSVGDEITIKANGVSVEQRHIVDEETGETTTFDWLKIE